MRLLTIILCGALTSTCFGADADFFISPEGNDTWSGTKAEARDGDGPFATIDRAKAAVRQLRQAQAERDTPVVVAIRGGFYSLPRTIQFAPEDSGTAATPTIFQAFRGEQPILSGGVRIDGFRRDDAGRYVAQLPEVAAGKWQFSQLYINDQRRYRPSWPPQGYHFVDKAVGGTGQWKQDRFRYRDGDINPAWKNPTDVECLPFHSWGISRIPVKSVDAEHRIVTLAGSTWHYSLAQLTQNTWYRMDNVAEAQRPGQWYLDRPAGSLIYMPLPDEKVERLQVIAPRLNRLVSIEGDIERGAFVDHVIFRGLTFAHCGWNVPKNGYSVFQAEVTLDGAITGRNARNIAIEDCIIRHTGAYAVDFGAGCAHNRIERCELVDLGAGGVKIGSGKFDKEEDSRMWASGCIVRDNLIAHGGRVQPAGIGVWIGHAANNTVEHNDILDFYQCAISVGWRWGTGPSPAHHNIIQHNHIHQIGQGVLSDLAGIYTLGESPGTVVRFNRIHDVGRARYGGWGIYNDESSSDIVMENNIVSDTEDAGYHLHHGRRLTVRNNIFARSANAQIQITNPAKSGTLTLERNIFFWEQGELFKGKLDDEITLRRNLYWNAKAPHSVRFADGVGADEWRKREEGFVVVDPMFVDPHNSDFGLKEGSPARQLGFEPIDLSRTGRLTTARRTTGLPAVPPAFAAAPQQPPIVLREDFELLATGQGLPGFAQQAASSQANAQVTEQTAASGRKSLQFTDGPEGATYFPHLNLYFNDLREGAFRAAMDLRVEKGAMPVFELRDNDPWYKSGPMFAVAADGTLEAGGKPLLKIPHGKWFHVELRCTIGAKADGAYQVIVTLPGEQPQRFEATYAKGFKSIGWVGFMATAKEPVVFYVDNLVLEPVDGQ